MNGLFGYPGALITLVRLQGIAELLLPFSVIVCSRGNVVYLQSQSVIEELLSWCNASESLTEGEPGETGELITGCIA